MSQLSGSLVRLAYSLFSSLKKLQGGEARDLPLNFGEILYQEMIMLDHAALENQIPVQQLDDAKFAISALLDEAIMKSQWPGKNAWIDQSLQWRLFGEHLAGVNFFNRLSRIRQNPESNLQVMILYYVCLQLGFQGKYALTQQEELKALAVDLKHQIDLHQGAFDTCLSCDLVGLSAGAVANKRKIPEWIWIGSVCGLLALLYLVYGLRVNHLRHENASQVNELISHFRTI